MKICLECGKPCETKVIDEGVGLTEAWGVVEEDTRLFEVSCCCDAEILEIQRQDVINQY